MQVESIISFGDSDGHVEVLDGRGMCPGGNGSCTDSFYLTQTYPRKYARLRSI